MLVWTTNIIKFYLSVPVSNSIKFCLSGPVSNNIKLCLPGPLSNSIKFCLSGPLSNNIKFCLPRPVSGLGRFYFSDPLSDNRHFWLQEQSLSHLFLGPPCTIGLLSVSPTTPLVLTFSNDDMNVAVEFYLHVRPTYGYEINLATIECFVFKWTPLHYAEIICSLPFN